MAKGKKPSARSQQRTMFGAAKSGAVQMQKIAFKAASEAASAAAEAAVQAVMEDSEPRERGPRTAGTKKRQKPTRAAQRRR
jgi:hypothetical protein